MAKFETKRIVIAGGGFAGIRAALDLEKQNLQNAKITLISKAPHFEYHAALYRVVTGRNPLEVCIPLSEIFKNKNVEIIEDEIQKIDLKNKMLSGKSGSKYKYTFLLLSLGSETSYFDIPGLEKLSFGLKSTSEALELKRHLHQLFEEARSQKDKQQQINNLHFVVVGGGATGTETAGELAVYTKKLAKNHDIDPSIVKIDLIHSGKNLLPQLPLDMAKKLEKRLKSLGVNLILDNRLLKEEVESAYLKDMELKTKTVVWTAGVTLNNLYKTTKGLKFDKDKKLEVNKYLEAKDQKNIFILGDAAAIRHPGMAQSAIYDGAFVGQTITSRINHTAPPSYKPSQISYAIPVGPGWAATLYKGMKFYGHAGWYLRRIADLKFFLSILPPSKAFRAFKSGMTLTESCPVCAPLTKGHKEE